ncbi:hypothetical protein [Mycobacterium sp.]|uniref:hypothetical protein n=1 Tax=Mycobacterium sp. TaxID=1785 RepID=UPI002D64B129|nr:hypothetical protein [Mycobacterium sp.]HZA11597.1 hypothetical protein [Mycobacterium sp.]
MRFVATMLLWLVTTVALAVAVPAGWAQKTLVDVDGYAALAQKAAKDPRLQDAMASELTTQVVALANQRGISVNQSLVRGVATAYSASPDFPRQFANANRVAHAWMFTDSSNQSRDSQGRWRVDLAPMLSDTAFQQMLSGWNIDVPATVEVPVAVTPADVHPGQLHRVATWGPWVSIGAAVLTGIFALLTLAAARRRGKAIAALGVSALLVGAGGWAAMEVGRRYIDDALNHTTGDVRKVADVMVGYAEGSLHQWLNLTLAAGGALVVFGIITTMLGSLRKAG